MYYHCTGQQLSSVCEKHRADVEAGHNLIPSPYSSAFKTFDRLS